MAVEGTGANCARDLGQGWKISPSVSIKAGEVFELADIDGPGAIQQIWMTPTGCWRYSILRVYWDGEETPSIETPIGDFFGMGWGEYAPLNSLPVCVNPGSAFNCYWNMPFRKHCRMTFTNIADEDMTLYYQITQDLIDMKGMSGPQEYVICHIYLRHTCSGSWLLPGFFPPTQTAHRPKLRLKPFFHSL